MKFTSLVLSFLILSTSAHASQCVLTDKDNKETVMPIEIIEEDGAFALGTVKLDGLFIQVERGMETSFDESGSNRGLFLSILVNSGDKHEGQAEVNAEISSKVELSLEHHSRFKKVSCEF